MSHNLEEDFMGLSRNNENYDITKQWKPQLHMSFPSKIFTWPQASGSHFRTLEEKQEMEEDVTGTTSMEMRCERSWRPVCFVCASRVHASRERREASKYIVEMIGGKVSYWSSDPSVECYENYRWIPLYKNTSQMSLPSNVFPPTMCLFSSHTSFENVREILFQTVCLSNKFSAEGSIIMNSRYKGGEGSENLWRVMGGTCLLPYLANGRETLLLTIQVLRQWQRWTTQEARCVHLLQAFAWIFVGIPSMTESLQLSAQPRGRFPGMDQ